jgi:threonine dehydrogenase-like Zn-dependent dehydrogenase
LDGEYLWFEEGRLKTMRAIYVDRDIPKALLVNALRGIWPGVVFSPLSPSRFADIPEPELPGPRWVRVENQQCGICASDLSLFFVRADAHIAQLALPGSPRIYLGHEVLGHVVEVGPGVTRVQLGDRVIMDTRFQSPTCLSQEIEPVCPHCAEGNYVRCENASADVGPHGVGGGWGGGFTAHETEIYRVPDDLTDDQAMMVEPISTGVRAVLCRMPEVGQKVLVVGGGTMGLNMVQCLRALAPDCHVTIATRHLHQSEMARRFGADEITVDEDGYQTTARVTGANLYQGLFHNRMLLGGFDVIYDCVGSAQSLQDSLRWVRAGGSVVLIGVNLSRFKLDLNPIWYQEVDLVGVYAHGVESWQGVLRHTYDVVIDLMRQGKLTADGFITHRFPLSEWRQAIATASDKRSGSIKVMFDYR